MSFLRSRPPIQTNRAQQRRALGAGTGVGTGPTIKRKIEKPAPQAIPENHTDYKLVSTSRDVLHHVMRFHGTKEVDPSTFTAPVKLQRKRNETNHYYRGYNYQNKYNNQNNKTGDDKKDGATTGAGGGANGEERKKKEIEAAPWVIEDYDSKNNWTGQLEGGQHANYVLFVFSDDGFKVVPADKWYKFSPKIPYTTLTAEEAEEQYQKSQKQNNNIRWLMRSKNKTKAEDGEEGVEEDAGHEQLMTVDHEDDVGYDEDEAKERKKKRGKHGDVDEMDFDEVWQDDEEMPAEMPGFEDDAKDDSRRNQGPSMDSDEDEDEEDDRGRLTETGKAVKKALLKLQKNKVYASDDDKDPYASDKDSSDSDLDEVDKEKEMKKEDESNPLSQETAKQKGKGKANAKAPLIAKKANAAKAATPNKPVTAKAVKTKVPMPTPRNVNASANVKTGALSSQSPKLPSNGIASSPAAAGVVEKKRKKMGDANEAADDGPSRKQPRSNELAPSAPSSSANAPADTGAPGDDSMLITEAEVIALLKSRPQVTTRDLIVDLKKKLRKEPRNKNILAAIVKKVATPHDGILVLKEGL
ncbi:hypothetical protein BCR41DRAFT_356735 [Lobosporangium transversale]|uniref:Transcription initiation factor IIF subunit alpha n=1 Tax=Lobosporangium transversale TaxID=64571 RepID=A0A1Y2GI46_9FUNG|nr:hypothetical protein BCR41DRAFT_356735 [Lobosporangium transversale]ORZ11673.1 hypothetical protein BCR41DRAFT_356735 [Lobosporangium transversale]|eukprot:XP_021879770.1 hypothetical protein BCR41DRAFT_356735 [Lobosporangium transversale]